MQISFISQLTETSLELICQCWTLCFIIFTDGGPSFRVYSPLHLQLHLHLWNNQGSLHAEQIGQATLCVSAVSDTEQNHWCPGLRLHISTENGILHVAELCQMASLQRRLIHWRMEKNVCMPLVKCWIWCNLNVCWKCYWLISIFLFRMSKISLSAIISLRVNIECLQIDSLTYSSEWTIDTQPLTLRSQYFQYTVLLIIMPEELFAGAILESWNFYIPLAKLMGKRASDPYLTSHFWLHPNELHKGL